MKETPATGVLDGQDAGVLELTLGVQLPPPPPVETLPPQPVRKRTAEKIAARQKAAKEAEIEIEIGSERKMRGSFTVVFPILPIPVEVRSEVASSELALAFARRPQARSERASAAHESQHDGWIFRRVVASGLRAERKSNGGQRQGQEKSVAGDHSNLLYSIHD